MRTSYCANLAPEIGRSAERLKEDHRITAKSKTQAGTALCDRCGAVGMHKSWISDRNLSEHFAADPLVRFVICPGCKRIEDKHYEGEVMLESPLLDSNKDMVYGTILHAEARAFLHNPLSRVAIIEDHGDKMRIVTTTCTLAERVGKAIHRALKGQIEIKPSPGEKFVLVKWSRH
jgi:NMD protein affecting ribosome stability and mRNA decay